LPIFDPKNVNSPSSPPPYSADLSPPDYFLFPELKMKLKGLYFANVVEIQEAVTDELKKVQKRNFWQLFRKCTTAQNPVHMTVELILNEKNGMCLRFSKKSVLKLLDHTVYSYFYSVGNQLFTAFTEL